MSPDPPEPRELAGGDILVRGDIVDRYVVLDPIGAGGMGEVYRAFDPELDRKVALKVLRNATDDETARDRLQREAQALARLHHPNVVSIFDVGTFGGQVFLAMELVEGRTLQAAIREGPLPGARAIELFVGAGSGLAAAHRAGLCHRDFKPANVLITDDGVAKVVDFGLAKPQATTPSGPVARGRLEVAHAEDPLSRSGSAAGTPLYMAPEVHRGKPADARSDQYSYCVALHEALTGRRPFSGATSDALLEAKRAPQPLRRPVPAHVRRAVARGLSFDPSERFDSMDGLLAALQRNPASRRRKLLLVLGALVIGATVPYGLGLATHEDPCALGHASWEGVWDPQRRHALQSAFSGTELPYAADAAAGVTARLDAYVEAWAAAYEDACRSPKDAVQALRFTCLEQRRREATAIIDALLDPDESAIRRAVQAVPAAPSVQACDADVTLLGPLHPPPPAMHDRVSAVRDILAEAKALERTGSYQSGLQVARKALEQAESIEYEPLSAEARYQLGRLQELTGDYEQALASLQAAHWLAEGARHETVAADAAIHVVFVLGAQRGELEAALRWSDHARAAIKRAADDTGARAELLNNLGAVQAKAGNYAAARDLYLEALELKSEIFGSESHEAALVRMNVAIVEEELGRYDAAMEQHRQVLATFEKSLGPRHPSNAAALLNLAATEYRSGDLETALEHYRQSLQMKREALGPDHPSVVYALDGVGTVLRRLGRFEESRSYHGEAVELAERVLGDDSTFRGQALHNLGLTLKEQGDFEEAREALREASRIWQAALGKQHPHVAVALSNLAAVEGRLGRAPEAIDTMKQARDIYAAAVPDHPQVAVMTANVGRLYHEAGDFEAARQYYEEARTQMEARLDEGHPNRLELDEYLGELSLDEGNPATARALLQPVLAFREANASAPLELARLRFTLARSLWPTQADRPRARELAQQAAAVQGDSKIHDQLRTKVEQWLTSHP